MLVIKRFNERKKVLKRKEDWKNSCKENICKNDKSLSEIQLEHEKKDELIVVVVKVVHELDCRMVVKEIDDGLLEEMEESHFGKEKFGWWFEQDIGGESEDDKEKKLVMVNEERIKS
ncbi:hypothetical protein Tco_0519815 [Tanacetum coccineum]